jgi:putative addiction module killer protein
MKPTNIIKVYKTKNNKAPFFLWLECIKNDLAQARVLARIDRLAVDNFGDCKTVGTGIWELRLHFGSGYRIYFAKYEGVLLLLGGDKSTQKKDITKAQDYFLDFKKEGKYETYR